MFTINKCLVNICKNNALSSFDENGNLINGKGYCLDHAPDPGLAQSAILNYIRNNEKIIGLNARGMIFKDIDFSNKKFFGCDFSHCTFQNIKWENTLFRISVFDFAFFNDCNFIQNNSLFTTFSCCTFTHTLFNASDMLQCNFNGAKAFQCSFDNSDFFSTRFINATLVDTSFRNCNLKKTVFSGASRENVSFKMSNTREAVFGSAKDPLHAEQADTLAFGNSIVDGDIK